MGGCPIRRPSAGAASVSSATVASPPQTSGRATTAWASAAHACDGRAAARRRPRNGIRPLSACGPSQASSAGSTVSEPATAMATTAMVPAAVPANGPPPTRNSADSEAITVTPDTRMVRPDVRDATRSASGNDRPLARSSVSRRR